MCLFYVSGHSKYIFNKPVKRVGKVGLHIFSPHPGWTIPRFPEIFPKSDTFKKILDI